MMKTFDDFRKSLTEEDMDYIANKANDAINHVDHTDALQIGTVSGLISAVTTLELLEKYHEWLHKNAD